MALEIEQSGINPTDRSAFIHAAQAIYGRQCQEGPSRGSNGERDDNNSNVQIPNQLAISDTDILGEMSPGQMAGDAENTPPTHDNGPEPITTNSL